MTGVQTCALPISSHPVKVGDVVEIDYASGVLKFRILNVKETVKKDEAASLYEIVND